MKEKNTSSMETVTLGRVPDSERIGWLNVAGIQAGIMISIPTLMLGGSLAASMPLGRALAAEIIGFVIAVVFMALIGMQSSDTGRPMCVVASSAFGRMGVRIFLTTLFSLALIAWFGFQTVVCGQSFSSLCAEFFGIEVNVSISIIIWGIVMLITAVWGINALGWLNKIAVPALIIVTILGTIIAIQTYGMDALYNYMPAPENEMTLFEGIVLAFGAQSVGMVVNGDITRFQKDRKSTIKGTSIGVLPASILMITMGYIMVVLTAEPDISVVLCSLGLPVLGMIVLILATWTTNTTNSYSAGIDMVMLFNVKDKYRGLMTIISGVIGTVLALLGIINFFNSFLVICGYAFAPVAGVMVADYWVIRKGQVDKWFYKDGFDAVGIVSWVAGVVLTVIMGTDFAVFVGMTLSFVLYIVLRRFVPEKIKMVDESEV